MSIKVSIKIANVNFTWQTTIQEHCIFTFISVNSFMPFAVLLLSKSKDHMMDHITKYTPPPKPLYTSLIQTMWVCNAPRIGILYSLLPYSP